MAGTASLDVHPLVQFQIKNPLPDVLRHHQGDAKSPFENQSVWRPPCLYMRRENQICGCASSRRCQGLQREKN